MPTGPIRAALAAAAILGLCACSRAPSAAPPPNDAAGDTPNACARDLAPADLAAVLGRSGVTARPTPGHPEACEFIGPGGRGVMVSLRSGDEVAPFWKLTVNANRNRMAPLAGLGDTALRTPDGAVILARRGALSCQVDLLAPSALNRGGADASSDALAQNLAAVCAKVFVARDRLDGRPRPAMVGPSPPQ